MRLQQRLINISQWIVFPVYLLIVSLSSFRHSTKQQITYKWNYRVNTVKNIINWISFLFCQKNNWTIWRAQQNVQCEWIRHSPLANWESSLNSVDSTIFFLPFGRRLLCVNARGATWNEREQSHFVSEAADGSDEILFELNKRIMQIIYNNIE